MSLMHAAWIHGHAMEVEFPDRIAHEQRAGFYYRLDGRAGTENWFHIAIPTPAVVNDQHLKIGSVLLRYRTAGGAVLTAVHVYDGDALIAHFDGLANHPETFVMERHEIAGSPQIRSALGLSISVRFPTAGARIEVAAAGGDFLGSAVVIVRPPA